MSPAAVQRPRRANLTALLTSAAKTGMAMCALLLLAGCVTVSPSIETPAGFAAFPDREEPTAISPDGVVLRVRTTDNRPTQTLDFWATALRRQMEESGYVLLDEGSFTGRDAAGVYFEWLAPLGDEDWVYLTALSVVDDLIVIAEAAGRFDLYEPRRTTLLAALERMGLEP
jgi:hypothetical protein